ncbi:testis-expressed protein 2-like [Bufo bufo]|uniref:testis-expressed protein 2-like n=1 Tax=Bufo bufo TaxID=8384 RepID=UPI001ABE2C63|nr:testis-expressed protein 2-like [Bufo bufo]
MSNSGKISPVPTGSPTPNHSLPDVKQAMVTQQSPQGITIQLTKVHSEDNWEDLAESELIFTLDQDEEEALASTLASRTTSPLYGRSRKQDGTIINELALAAYECAGDVLLSGETQKHSPFLSSSPTSKPLNLVKSVSTEIDVKDPTLHKPHPFVNLVKSISTEISRLEPEVTQSKSDSKLNVHLWRQITQPRGKNGDSRTAPSSPSTSPSESKGMFFNVQDVEAKLEDTKRKLSEAMQEPLSMLSKMIGEETSPNPKYRTMSPLFFNQESPSSQGIFESKNTFTNYGRLDEKDIMDSVDPAKAIHREEPKNHCKYKICSYGDMIQVVELTGEDVEDENVSPTMDDRPSSSHNNDVPFSVLVCIAILAYNFFIWPLPAYISGLFMGIASGLILGFFLVLLLVPKRSCSRRHKRYLQECEAFPSIIHNLQEQNLLQGWMNEMFSYDPEFYHPALTHSVFVTLEGTTLKRSYAKSNLPRRSIYGEEIPETVFLSHDTNNLTNAQVFLYPDGLANKRIWNKKYPICIQLCDPEDPEDQNAEVTDTKSDMSPRRDPEGCERSIMECKAGTLYLFGRTGRDKEEWYQHLVRASRGSMTGKQDAIRGDSKTGSLPNPLLSPCSWGGTSNSSMESTEDASHISKPKDLAANVRQKILLDYATYMSRFISTDPASPVQSPRQSVASSPTPPKKEHPMEQSLSINTHVCWVNAFIGRMFWDFLQEKYWEDVVANKIQKKLTKIKLPNFMDELTLTGLDMGTSLPQILTISSPSMNERGLWMDMDVTYSGSLQVTLETKMNLSRLGKEATVDEGRLFDNRRFGAKVPRSSIFTGSDEESSSAGSSEDEEITVTETPGNAGDKANPNNAESFPGGNSTSRRILRFVDKIAKSRCFQKATENEYIKRKIEEMSNTPLLLTVELQELGGTLAVNIPPPPTDRIWYSFRAPPQVEMKIRPKLGEREVTFMHVTEWIEKKLQDEFQKILVMPNMDDLLFPIMQSGLNPSRQPQTDQSIPGPL